MVKGITHILINNVNFQNEAGKNKAAAKYKAYPVVCAQPEEPPYSVVRQTSYVPMQCMTGRPTTYEASFVVASYHKNFEDCEDLDSAVRDALDRQSGTHNGVVFQLITHENTQDGDYDVNRGCYVKVSSFNAVVNEDHST